MDLTELERAAEAGHLTCVHAADFLHGCVYVEDEGSRWVRPYRLTRAQERAIGSCRAWHPGLYRQMALATAGVACAFRTDASEVVFELRVDTEPSGTRRVVKDVESWHAGHSLALKATDGLSIEVDGQVRSLSLPQSDDHLFCLALDDPQERPRANVPQLPIIGGLHDVRLWLPALRGCQLRRVWANGTVFDAAEDAPKLLVLGDSIAQGFVTGDPASAWPARLARRLEMDLINQSIGGQVFQPDSLIGLKESIEPATIIVAFGANYRYERCAENHVAADIRAYLNELAQLWSDVSLWVVTPTWHDENASPSHERSCWRRVPDLLAENADRVGAHLVNGLALLDATHDLLADGVEHPNAAGAAQIAERLYTCLEAQKNA